MPDDCWDDPQERPEPVAVPHAELSAAALRGVIDNFVLREGTDYGDRTVSHEQKVAQVLQQLERGEARILFDPLDSTVTIVSVQPGRKRGQERTASST
jgi:uncharacterized protein YheU (UPF0270 family)